MGVGSGVGDGVGLRRHAVSQTLCRITCTLRFASTLTSCFDLLEAQRKRVQSRQPDKPKLGEWPYAHLHVGVSVSVGEAVGANVGDGVGVAVGDGVGVDVGAGVGA